MATLTSLPPEIVEHIIFCVFLGEQYTPPSVEGFMIDDTDSLITMGMRSTCITEYTKSKITTGSFTDGVLALHAFPRTNAMFHIGLHRMFYEQRCRRNGLLALSLTSRCLYKLVQPLLWSLVEIGSYNYWLDRPLEELIEKFIRHANSRLLLALMRQPDLGLLIKTFSFEYVSHFLMGWQDLSVIRPQKDETSGEGYWYNELGSAKPELTHLLPEDSLDKSTSYWTSTCHLLAYLPNLHSLKLLISEERHLRWLSESFLSQLAGLQNLTELSMVWQGKESIDFEGLMRLFFLPALRVLYLSGLIFDARYITHEGDSDIVPEVPVELKRKSKIRKLILDFMNVDTGPLIAVLQLPAGLESFTHSYTSDQAFVSKFSPGCAYDLLYPHRNTLQHLDLIEHRDLRMQKPFSGRRAEELLKDFWSLKMLGCPAYTLKSRRTPSQDSWKEDLKYGRQPIHVVLPDSLESLKLYLYDDWDMSYTHIDGSVGGWAEDLSSLFEMKALQCPKLKNIWVEYWPLSYLEIESRDDALPYTLEQMMARVQLLKLDAAKVGINLEVRVDTKSKTRIG